MDDSVPQHKSGTGHQEVEGTACMPKGQERLEGPCLHSKDVRENVQQAHL